MNGDGVKAAAVDGMKGAGNFGASVGKKALSSLGPANIAFSAFDFTSNLNAGDSVGLAATKWAGTTAAFAIAPWTMTAATLAPAAYKGIQAAHGFRRQRAEWWQTQERPNGAIGGNYMDTSRALTMRQAAVTAIQGNKLNARSALGGEARILHRNTVRGY